MDVAPNARIFGVLAQRLRRFEVEVALKAQAGRQYAGLQLGDPDGTDLRAAESQVAEPFGDIGIATIQAA